MPIPFPGAQTWTGTLLNPHPRPIPPRSPLPGAPPRPSHLRRARSLPDRLPDPVRPPHPTPAATRAAASLA